MKFRKKPVTIEAEEFKPDTLPLPFRAQGVCCYENGLWFIQTLEGRLELTPGDWVIRGVKGEFYPIKPDIFAETYEPVGGSENNEGGSR